MIFHIYINGQEVNLRILYEACLVSPSYGLSIKDTILFNSTQNGKLKIRSRSDIPFGHFELYTGDFEDKILRGPNRWL